MNVVLSEKNAAFKYAIIYFSVPKRGDAIIRGGAIFGGNTVMHLTISRFIQWECADSQGCGTWIRNHLDGGSRL